MTSAAKPASPLPLLTAEQANVLLEQVIYEQLIDAIDFDALFRLEQALGMALCGLVPEPRLVEVARALIDRVWPGILDDPRRFADLRRGDARDCACCALEAEPRARDDRVS